MRVLRHPRPRRALFAAACFALVACDTGDGKTLRDPTGTSPPTVASTVVIDGGDTLASLPLDDPFVLPDEPVAGESVEGEFRVIAPWLDGEPIDPRHTCDGEDVSPALSWVAPPADTSELAIVVVDESIANGPPFVHWVIAGIDPADVSLIEATAPIGAVQGLNFFGDVGWGGPCPPVGDGDHLYRFTVFALNQQVELADGTPATDLLDFIQAVSIASTDVTGTYRR